MAYNVIMLPAAEDDYGEILLYFEKQFDSKQIRSTSVLSSSDIQEDVTKLYIRKKYYKDTETNCCEESMIQV